MLLTKEDGSAVSVEDATFAWKSADTDPVLSGVTMHVPERSLTMIVGKVGSGKSSLLSAILGEMRLLSGTVNLKGSVAYVAQQAWIQNASVRDNILFGSRYEPGRYRAVLEVCALINDLSILPWGDQTEVGEKAINLSGGQKQRMALARAVYSDQDIYVLDDPLSAVDVHVGKHIYERVVGPQGMLKDKTRILVTHGVQWLPQADQVIVLHQGTVRHTGTYQQLLSQDTGFIHIMTQQGRREEEEEEEEEITGKESVDGGKSEGSLKRSSDDVLEHDRSLTLVNRIFDDGNAKMMGETGVAESINGMKDGGKIIKEERIQQGKIKLDVVISWFKAGGLKWIALTCVFIALDQATTSLSAFWIMFWTADPYLANTTLAHTQEYADTNVFYLEFMCAFACVQALFLILSQLVYWISSIHASRHLHRRMLAGVLKSSMSFFDTTPTGRMLNRFTEDIDEVDGAFPVQLNYCLKCAVPLATSIIVVSINVPLFATTIVPIFLILCIVLIPYYPTVYQLKRMDAVAKSPIYSHSSEAVGGASTIRAFGHTSRFLHTSMSKIDDSMIRALTLQSCKSWLLLVTDLIGDLLMFSAALFAVLSTGVEGAAAGLVMSCSFEFFWLLGFSVYTGTEATASCVSIERILEYIHLKLEDQHYERRATGFWPSHGQIEFKDLQVRYRDDLDLALKGVNGIILPGEKVGIVGRTGAGKSTITLALFRMIEAAGGAIFIDNVNIAYLPLVILRSKLSILPQDPVLFSGSLRMNLDPDNEYTDDQVKQALEQAHLGEVLMSSEGGLSFDVGERGTNLSVGQCQLVCLARALLKQNKILVLDEATAAVDVHTDSFIQETIRTEFRDCTVLTIAHRINTIMDYDRVMVLENGEVKEFAPLQDLLSNPDSLFYRLAKEAKLF